MSGVYIKGMEMPISCAKCGLFGEYGCPFIGAVGYALTQDRRNEDCPLVPVPPHGRLIDGDIAEVITFTNESGDFADGILYAADWIAAQPTIIEADEGE